MLTIIMTTVPDSQPVVFSGPLWNLEVCETITHQDPRPTQEQMSSENARRLSFQGQCTTKKCSSIQQRQASDPGC